MDHGQSDSFRRLHIPRIPEAQQAPARIPAEKCHRHHWRLLRCFGALHAGVDDSAGGDLMSNGTVQLLNGMYAIARKKTELNHQEKMLIRKAAQMLEMALKKIEQQKALMYDMEERIAIIRESNGELEDDGTPFTGATVKKTGFLPDDFWAEDSCE